MRNLYRIRLLAPTNNEKGDLFSRLCQDFFFSMGYDELRYDIHKTGRELDIQGVHRLENRKFVAECKAHDKKIGGSDLNKFRGVAALEKEKAEATFEAYFISLNGFTESSIEQEAEIKKNSIILVDDQKLIGELINRGLVIKKSQAQEIAGRCCQYNNIQDGDLDGYDIIGHELGYLWLIYYSYNKKVTHFILVHADGTALDREVIDEIVELDKADGGILHKLKYINPPNNNIDEDELERKAEENYKHWLEEECGYIHLDGLPADSDLSVMKLKLEKLFVPLNAEAVDKSGNDPVKEKSGFSKVKKIGEFFEQHDKLSILASPGGGKSTLLKRIAISYAFPKRRHDADDRLPDRDYFPLLLRCRELRDRATLPIVTLLNEIAVYAELDETLIAHFRKIIQRKLHQGKLLLLIDGLDEISNESERKLFTKHLRTFLSLHPNTSLIITSREAGYRLVAGVIAGLCYQIQIAPFNREDVFRLCMNWRIELVKDTPKIRNESKVLAAKVWENHRIRALVVNPLLLTTLLVVERYIRELPRSRTELYREAIRVLIRTWNVEGFSPLDERETLAQLSYVAYEMMQKGAQRIGHKDLLKLLTDARYELEAELQFTKISAAEFIERVEYRSSLLIQNGYELINGEQQAVYEFRHLTFQEYLAARAIIEEQYRGREEQKHLTELLEPHYYEENWQETILLAILLAGRKAEDTIVMIVAKLKFQEQQKQQSKFNMLFRILVQCIDDEVLLKEKTLKEALLVVAKYYIYVKQSSSYIFRYENIIKSKFGKFNRDLVEDAFFSDSEDWSKYVYAFDELVSYEIKIKNPKDILTYLKIAGNNVKTKDYRKRVKALAMFTKIAYEVYLQDQYISDESRIKDEFERLKKYFLRVISSKDPRESLMASWTLIWILERRLWNEYPLEYIFNVMCEKLISSVGVDEKHFYCSVINLLPLLDVNKLNIKESVKLNEIVWDLQKYYSGNLREKYTILKASIIIEWYICDKSQYVKLLRKIEKYEVQGDRNISVIRKNLENMIYGKI